MKAKKFLAMLLTLSLALGMTACGGEEAAPEDTGGDEPAAPTLKLGYDLDARQEVYGPYYDEWSDMTDEELYEMAKEEDAAITVYATSSKMMKEEEPFEEAYPDLDLVVFDLDSDEVLNKAKIENETGNITADVLQAKDVNGNVFYEWYNQDIIEPFYPRDICEHIDPAILKYSYPLYASQAFWYYNTEAYPEGQPIHNWWELVEKNEDGSQKYQLFAKEIGQETAYLSLFASFVVNAEEMEQAYKDTYGEELEYTYDASNFDFEVPEKNAGVEFLWRFSQAKITFINDGDELVLAVNNTPNGLALASASKKEHQEKSGYNIGWCTNLSPYTGLLNIESLFVVKDCNSPAGARLFLRWLTGGVDGKSGGLKAFTKMGNWPVRDDVEDKKNPASLPELGAKPNDLKEIYSIFPDVQDMWTFWLDQNPHH